MWNLEGAVFNGTDPTQFVVAITALIQETTAAVIKLEVDLTAYLNGKVPEIVALLVVIINVSSSSLASLLLSTDACVLDYSQRAVHRLGQDHSPGLPRSRCADRCSAQSSARRCRQLGGCALGICRCWVSRPVLLVGDVWTKARSNNSVDAIKLLQVGLNACANILGLN